VEQFLATQTGQIPLVGFLINLVLTALLCFILGRIYVSFGWAPSNRRAFARNFVMIGMTTMLIISVVKSSLALSLGLVGALSIVRFRAAIKEPEELAYLFLVISIGLGLGADQRWITIVAFAIIAAVVVAKQRMDRRDDVRHLHLTVSSPQAAGMGLSAIVGVLEKHVSDLTLSRFDEGQNQIEASFKLDLAEYRNLEQATAELRRLNDSVKVTYLNFADLGS
jgi:uncharacterized membrane protein YhiD involved in acid resistance